MIEDVVPASAPFDGRWWSPDDASEVVGGRLSLVDEVWQLQLNGWLGDWTPGSLDSPTPPVIFGSIGTVPVTLLELVPGGHSGGFEGRPY